MRNGYLSAGFNRQVGIDFGSETLRLTLDPHESVLEEPSIVVVNRTTNRVVAIGQEAADLRGRTPEHFEFIQPVVEGVIAHPKAAVALLSQLCYQHRSWLESIMGQNFLLAIPAQSVNTEVRTFRGVCEQISSRSIRAVPAPIGALIGIGITVDDPLAQMIIDIGAGTTDIGVISSQSLIRHKTTTTAGSALDEAIQDYIRNQRNLQISLLQARDIKHQTAACGGVDPDTDSVSVYGQDTASRLPREITVTSTDIRRAIQPVVDDLTTFVQNFLQSVSADTAADIYTHGVHLTGGGAALPGLAAELEEVLSISVYEYDQPETAVVRGLGAITNRPDLQQSIANFNPYENEQT